MPDVPQFWKRIPGILGRLDRSDTPEALNVASVARLLDCTTANARRWLKDEGPRLHYLRRDALRKVNGGWMVRTTDLAAMLHQIYEAAGGDRRALPTLQQIAPRAKVEIPAASAAQDAVLEQNVRIVARGASCAVEGPCLVIAGATLKDILACVGMTGRRILANPTRHREAEAQLQGRRA